MVCKKIGNLISNFVDCASGRSLARLKSVISDLEQKIEAKNREIKYTLLVNNTIRHDINNLLTASNAYTALALKALQEGNYLEAQEFLKKDEISLERVNNQIFLWKNYQTEEQLWSPLDKIVEYFKNFETNTLKIQVNNEMGDMKIFTSSLCRKVADNLVDNSIRHGGATIIELTFLKDHRNQDLLFLIEDNGTGIIPEEKEKIFEKGFGKNTGWGLFLSREILAITGITISETGEYGRGVRFEIRIPKSAYKK
ncbi:MAG: HAMP domain-containing sensor histidine kinase [Candidatus Pacebacteria bacterium]|nr:HAMP domain-containing sensor histidine kinase [Candidatus Paceibacterota bacterium]